LGTFSSEIEAAVAYDVSAVANHGPEAALNFPYGVEREIMSFLKEAGVYVTIFTPEGEVERAVAGGPEAYAELVRDGVIPEHTRSGMTKKPEGMKRKRGARKGSAGSVDASTPRDLSSPLPETPGSASPRLGLLGPGTTPGSLLRSGAGRSGAGRPKKISKLVDENELVDDGDEDEATNNMLISKELRETGLFMPDARTLNRLISWLLTSETARLWKCESKDKLKALVANANGTPLKLESSGDETPMDKEEEDNAGDKKDLQTDIPRLIGSKAWQLEEQILTRINDVMDVDAISQLYANVLDPYEDCEMYLARGQQEDAADPSSMLDESGEMSGFVSPVGRICAENLSRGIPALTFSDCQVVSSALLLHGAPVQSSSVIPQYRMEFLRNVMCAPYAYPMRSVRMDSSSYEQTLQVAKYSEGATDTSAVLPEVFHGYTWADFQARFCPWIDPTLLCFFYVEIWLPFCASLTRRGIKPRETTNLKMIPLPYYNLSEHHPSNRGLCIQFLQRQQMLRACQYVLANYFGELWDYLRSPERLICMHGLPVWWTPYVHDLALVFACAKHGFLNSSYMREDPELPFNEACIERNMRFFVQYGSLSVVPVALGAISKDSDDMEAWIRQSVQEFPDISLLEARLERILDDLTKDLVSSHPCRVSIVLGRLNRYGFNPNGSRIGCCTIEEAVANYHRSHAAAHADYEAEYEDQNVMAAYADAEVSYPLSSGHDGAASSSSSSSSSSSQAGAGEDSNVFMSMIRRGRSDSNTIPAYIHQASVSRTPLKDMVCATLRSRRIHVSEFKPARPTSFEICEYSENLLVSELMAREALNGGNGNGGNGDNASPGPEEVAGEERRRILSQPVLKAAKLSGFYSNFKKGV
jgi:hypothetical protein